MSTKTLGIIFCWTIPPYDLLCCLDCDYMKTKLKLKSITTFKHISFSFNFLFIYSPTPHYTTCQPSFSFFSFTPHHLSSVNHAPTLLIKGTFYSLANLFWISSTSLLSHQPFYPHSFFLWFFSINFFPSLHRMY